MVIFRPIKIPGRWRDGYALDYHTVSSTYLGEDEFGHRQFDTKRSEVGELLYRLKYQKDNTVVASLVETVASFITKWNPNVDMIVPIPPTRTRVSQPVLVLAETVSKRLGLLYMPGCVMRSREVPELKNVYNYNERIGLLTGTHTIDKEQVQGKRLLLFDDLFRSGAIMNAITIALYEEGSALDVFALTITRTRSNQ